MTLADAMPLFEMSLMMMMMMTDISFISFILHFILCGGSNCQVLKLIRVDNKISKNTISVWENQRLPFICFVIVEETQTTSGTITIRFFCILLLRLFKSSCKDTRINFIVCDDNFSLNCFPSKWYAYDVLIYSDEQTSSVCVYVCPHAFDISLLLQSLIVGMTVCAMQIIQFWIFFF